jgi:hypothetical protein
VILHLATDLGGGLWKEEAPVVHLVRLAAVDLQTGGRPSRPGIMMRIFLLLFIAFEISNVDTKSTSITGFTKIIG